MKTTVLRKLSNKSKIGFGKFADLRVSEIINLQRKAYLRWLYYNVEGITFLDEILEQIGISETYLINKPGKNPDMYEQLDANVYEAKRHNIYYIKHMKKFTKNYKIAKEISIVNKERFLCKKSVNQNRNIKR
jgi:hypothetical protein